MVFDDVGGDTWQQYTMHYASIVNHLRAGTFSLWDFTNGMGTNMFLLSLFDPSLILLYVIGVILGAAHMLFYLVWIQILKILVAGFVFYLFFSCKKIITFPQKPVNITNLPVFYLRFRNIFLKHFWFIPCSTDFLKKAVHCYRKFYANFICAVFRAFFRDQPLS